MKREVKADAKFQIRVNKELREEFKEACAYFGEDAAGVLREAMEKKIKDYRKDIKKNESN